MHAKPYRLIATFIAGCVLAEPAAACTLCHSSVAEQVRAALFAAGFWSNFAAVAAPLPLLVGVVLLAARRG